MDGWKDRFIQHNSTTLSSKLKKVHAQKIEVILHQRELTTIQAYVNKGKWVVNASSWPLSQEKTQAQSRGLNFSITPKDIPTPKIVAAVESGIYNLP